SCAVPGPPLRGNGIQPGVSRREDPYCAVTGRETDGGVVKGRVLVAGFATRHVAQSAHRAGYEVCAVDHFCDQDLAWCTSYREKFEDLADLPDAIDRIAGRHSFDLFVATSGAEDLPVPIPLCGTPGDRIG